MASLACWTCRLRRKRCDRTRPVCKSCSNLNIGCCYSKERPEWMDGAEKQLAKTRMIKAQVKQGVTARRGGSEAAIRVFSLHTNQQAEQSPTAAPETSPASSSGPSQTSAGSSAPASDGLVGETENFLITLYLDTVFPLLFPQYKPATLSGGRSWISALLRTNKAVYHSVLSTSAYYFTLILAKDATHTLRTPCEQHVWDTLDKHMEMSIRAIKHDMDQYHSQGPCLDIFSKLHVLEGVAQYLIFVTAMPQGADWKMHLSAALTLLNEMLQSHGISNGTCSLESIIQMMDRPSIFVGIDLGFCVWNNDQAAFQFYASFLLYADVIAGIQLGRPSQLQQFHQSLIANREAVIAPGGRTEQLPGLENYIGCHGWILATLSEISEMEAAKRYSQPKGKKLLAQRMIEGHYLKIKLQIRIQEVDANIGLQCHTMQLGSTRPRGQDENSQLPKDVLLTKIWLHAAMIYLSVVLDGWHLGSLHIRENVSSILGVLGSFPSELSVRSVMLPLCISGFFALPEQECIFRHLFSTLESLQALGPAKRALRLIEQVWELRDELDENSWGLYDCFQIMESDVLLI
ncbi:fungal-specific transcription factor domain-containing protein [Trichoderma austrokoningii]